MFEQILREKIRFHSFRIVFRSDEHFKAIRLAHVRKVNFTHRQILLPAVSKLVKIVDNDHTNVHKTPQTRFYLDHKR